MPRREGGEGGKGGGGTCAGGTLQMGAPLVENPTSVQSVSRCFALLPTPSSSPPQPFDQLPFSRADFREVLHQSIARQFQDLANKVQPDRIDAGLAQAEIEEINNDRELLLGWVVELCDGLADVR